MSWPASVTWPDVGLRRPTIASISSSWPFPATPAMPRISPARTSRSISWTTSLAAVVANDQLLDLERDLAGVRLAAIDDQGDLAADHQLGEVLLVGLGRDPLADDLAAPDDRDPVRDVEDLVELVADEDDAVTLGRQAPQDLEDLLGLLGREDGGRLVEHEHPRVAVEGLEDLDPLLPADGQRSDLGLRVDLEAEPAAELDDLAVGLLPVEEAAAGGRLLAEDDVLGDGQDRHEHEVLVDHADAAMDGIGRAASAAPPGHRSGSGRRPGVPARTGCSSGSSCRRRSRRAGRGSRRAGCPGRSSRWRRHRDSAS